MTWISFSLPTCEIARQMYILRLANIRDRANLLDCLTGALADIFCGVLAGESIEFRQRIDSLGSHFAEIARRTAPDPGVTLF
jgi:hypothetical protein